MKEHPGLAGIKKPCGSADLFFMAATISRVCDPEFYKLADAIQQAKLCAQEAPCFEMEVVKFLQTHCLSGGVDLPTVFRGVEILGAIVEESRLITLLRPFLRSSDPQIASKCVLVLGRQSRNIRWIKDVIEAQGSAANSAGILRASSAGSADDRIRANLVESIWERREPEVEQILQNAVKDKNHRVAANAVYGLYLWGSGAYAGGLEQLVGHNNPAFRRSAIWVIRSIGAPDAALRIRTLITDGDAGVRRAAFAALVHLRNRVCAETVVQTA
jgi:hypothetical protein